MKNYEIKPISGGTKLFAKYTRYEIKKFWKENEEYQRDCTKRSYNCYTYPCSEEDALRLSALFIRNVYADPKCVYYDGQFLSIYCPSYSGFNILEGAKKEVLKYDIFGVDEHGELFEWDDNDNI